VEGRKEGGRRARHAGAATATGATGADRDGDAAIALKGFARCDATTANLFWIGLTTCPIQDNP
jgi:hypothetical protein